MNNICPICKINKRELKSGHCKRCNREYMREYARKHKEYFLQLSKNFRKKNPNYYKEYYEKNREHFLQLNKEYYEKNPNYNKEYYQKNKVKCNIKRTTRYKYPLENQDCLICNHPATERHHFTEPIHQDYFLYCCHRCHNIIGTLKINLNRRKNAL